MAGRGGVGGRRPETWLTNTSKLLPEPPGLCLQCFRSSSSAVGGDKEPPGRRKEQGLNGRGRSLGLGIKQSLFLLAVWPLIAS